MNLAQGNEIRLFFFIVVFQVGYVLEIIGINIAALTSFIGQDIICTFNNFKLDALLFQGFNTGLKNFRMRRHTGANLNGLFFFCGFFSVIRAFLSDFFGLVRVLF